MQGEGEITHLNIFQKICQNQPSNLSHHVHGHKSFLPIKNE